MGGMVKKWETNTRPSTATKRNWQKVTMFPAPVSSLPQRDDRESTYNTNRWCLAVSRELYDLLARCIQLLRSLLARAYSLREVKHAATQLDGSTLTWRSSRGRQHWRHSPGTPGISPVVLYQPPFPLSSQDQRQRSHTSWNNNVSAFFTTHALGGWYRLRRARQILSLIFFHKNLFLVYNLCKRTSDENI